GHAQESLVGGGRRTPATVRGRLYDLPAGYPALALPVEGEAGDQVGRVHGELVEVDDPRVLALLDHYEGVAEGLFRRAMVEAVVGLRRCRAWAYVMDDPRRRGGRAVPSGRWG